MNTSPNIRATALRRPGSGYSVDPRAWLRIGAGIALELVDELAGAYMQRRDDVRPRMRRGWRFVGERIVTNVPLRVLSTSMVIHEVKQGSQLIYVDYTGYDATSHHTGPERRDTFGAAEKIDRSIGHILDAARLGPRRYHLVILSDHGQSLGTPFRQLYGITLVQLVAAQMGEGTTFDDTPGASEYSGGFRRIRRHVLGDRMASGIEGLLGRGPGRGRPSLSRIVDGHAAPLAAPADAQVGDVVVCASGNLGLIYLTAIPGRMTREAIDDRYPGLIEALVGHPGIGLLVLRSREGVVAIGRAGTNLLDENRVVGVDPIAKYGPTAVDALRRISGFEHSGDIIAFGSYDPTTDQVVSFEELVGSHGGLGGHQDDAFIAYPGDWALTDEPLIGAPAIHRQLRRWLTDLSPDDRRSREPDETA